MATEQQISCDTTWTCMIRYANILRIVADYIPRYGDLVLPKVSDVPFVKPDVVLLKADDAVDEIRELVVVAIFWRRPPVEVK